MSSLSLRLYALPLIYLWHMLPRPQNLWLASSCIDAEHSRRLLTKRALFRGQEARSYINTDVIQAARAGITRPFRVIGRLYDFGRAIDQDPTIIRSVSRFHKGNQNRHREASTSGTHSPGESARQGWKCPSLEEPATASQVCHTALPEGRTLDNVLAILGAYDEVAVTGDHSLSSSTRTTQSCHKCDRYRNSSIQTTPESMLTPRKGSITLSTDIRNISGAVGERACPQSSSSTIAVPDKSAPQMEADPYDILQSDSVSACNDASFIAEHEPIHSHQDESPVSPQLKGCPSFMRRQTRSKLPRRPYQSDMLQPVAAKLEGQISTASVEPTTPTKRNKLHRKSRVIRT